MNSLQLRPHQIEGLERLRHGFASGHHAQILYGPCAFGKTEVAISMMDGAARKGKLCHDAGDRTNGVMDEAADGQGPVKGFGSTG